jgi:predicted ATPase with chaperone activity
MPVVEAVVAKEGHMSVAVQGHTLAAEVVEGSKIVVVGLRNHLRTVERILVVAGTIVDLDRSLRRGRMAFDR